ncbi:MAG: hypothetical protein ABEJ82_07470 [Haloplanus sp.]
MKVRGQRECRECGGRWSYYETGSVACPACGSLRSVGVGERALHTDAPVELDLTTYRDAADEDALAAHADDLKSDLRRYVHRRGFVDGGDLEPLDDAFLVAHELKHAVDVYARSRDPSDDERLYVFDLLRGADAGERPAPDRVPEGMEAARGLGYARALDDYRRDVASWLDEHPDDAARRTLGTLDERVKRIEALQGEVAPAEVERLVSAAREVGEYLAGEESALARAQSRLATER